MIVTSLEMSDEPKIAPYKLWNKFLVGTNEKKRGLLSWRKATRVNRFASR